MNAPARTPSLPGPRNAKPIARQNSAAVAERAHELVEQRKACRALERMQAERPLKPPPYSFGDCESSAARRALRRDIELGAYSPRLPYVGTGGGS